MRLYQGEIVSLVFSCILCNAFQKDYSLPHLLATLSHLVKCGSIRIQLLPAVCSSVKFIYENVLIRQAYICSKKHSTQRIRPMSLQCYLFNHKSMILFWFCISDESFQTKIIVMLYLCYVGVNETTLLQRRVS